MNFGVYNNDRRVTVTALSISLAGAMFIAAASSTIVATHNCSIEGHECTPGEVIKEVEVNCRHQDAASLAATSSATIAEKALLLELDRPGGRVEQASILRHLDQIRKEREIADKDKAAAEWDREKTLKELEVALAKAKAQLTIADTENEIAQQKWAALELSWAKSQNGKMKEALDHLKSMKVLAEAIKEQHIELMNAVETLDVLEFKPPEVEAPDRGPIYGGGGKYGSKNMQELLERQRKYFTTNKG
jgi:hypothetical protein